MKQYVQHKSGQGEKWEVVEDRHGYSDVEWRVKAKLHEYHHDLPKSEYIPCDPPEEWEDVTDRCEVGSSAPETWRGSLVCRNKDGVGIDVFNQYQMEVYRVRKLSGIHNGPCFIVERKKS